MVSRYSYIPSSSNDAKMHQRYLLGSLNYLKTLREGCILTKSALGNVNSAGKAFPQKPVILVELKCPLGLLDTTEKPGNYKQTCDLDQECLIHFDFDFLQLSYGAWRKMMYGFWLTVIVYSMLVLVGIYIYQFEYVPQYLSNYTGIPDQL